MVIQNYNVQTSSQRTSMSLSSTTMLAVRNLTGGQNTPQISTSFSPDKIKAYQNPQDTAAISQAAKAKGKGRGIPVSRLSFTDYTVKNGNLNQLKAKNKIKPPKTTPPGQAKKANMPTNPQELKDKLMELMFELLSKRSGSGKISASMSSVSMSMSGVDGAFSFSSQSISLEYEMSFFGSFFGISENSGPALAGWQAEQFRYEQETVSYQAQGVVNTADGRTIEFDVNMYMSRQYAEYLNFDVEATRLYDPLVINYAGTAASLTGEKFSFDLTSDGKLESLAMLAEGSGFLAIDKNGDGKINDGSELFGPNSGCGFSELREYDKDGNGWIDEADEVFEKLLIWHKDAQGNEKSYTLKELGIGAIYLGDIATEFTFKGEGNETLGVMRSTSFFLKENGGAGTLSHIDLAV